MGRKGNTEAERAPQTLAGTTPCPGPFARYPFVRYPFVRYPFVRY